MFVQFTEIDYETGILGDNQRIVSNTQTHTEIKVPAGSDVPTYTNKSTNIFSHPGQYIMFTHTDFYADVGQTTIPFFDAQEVSSDPPMALSGVGLYYKTLLGSGGFVAPMIVAFNERPKIGPPSKRVEPKSLEGRTNLEEFKIEVDELVIHNKIN